MKNEPQIPHAQAPALERFAFLTQIQDLLRQGFPLSLALEQMSLRPMNWPDGRQRLCARRTLEDGWYAYQQGGFAALTPKVRADKGQPRTPSAPNSKSGSSNRPRLIWPCRSKCSAGAGANTILNCLPSTRSTGSCGSMSSTPKPVASNCASLWAARPSASRRRLSTTCG